MGVGVGGGGGWGVKTAEILLAESCHEQASFESGFKQRKGRRISEIGWQRVPENPSIIITLPTLILKLTWGCE